jgi:hypothetical protein
MGGKGSTSAVSGAMEGEASVAEGICRFPACSGSICWCNCELVHLGLHFRTRLGKVCFLADTAKQEIHLDLR